jgi:potassium/hydrogen antiporter
VDIEHILRDFGLILGAGLVSQLIATVTKLPQMVVLVAAGALIGPSVLGLVSNPLSGVGAQLLFNIGVALILFHGGTGISLRVISGTAIGLGLLVLPGVLLTALVVALVVSPVFGVAFPVALLVGAVLAATDPAILIPLFDRLKLRPKVSQTVIAESAFNFAYFSTSPVPWTTISRDVESLLGNTFSRIVATQGLRPAIAHPGQYTRGRFGCYSRLLKKIQSNES